MQNEPAAADNDMKFDDINLNDDKAAPKLDLDFGLGGTSSEKRDPDAEPGRLARDECRDGIGRALASAAA